MKRDMSKVWLCVVTCILIASVIPVYVIPVYAIGADEKTAETYPTVSVKIHRIAKVDEIEGWGEGGADWYYHVGISEDGSDYTWEHSSEPIANDDDDVTVDVTYSFTDVSKTSVYIAITLCEDDFWSDDDLADISSQTTSGLDNVASSIQPPTTGVLIGSYIGVYNLKTNALTGDTTYTEEGYYKTSGDYDGSTDTDQNDADVWFDVWDNYASPTANAGSDQTVYTGNLVNFNGGSSYASTGSSLTKYQWDFNNDGTYDAEGATTSHTYTTKGVYTVTLKVTDSLGETDTDTCIITVQNRVPTAAFTYSPTSPTTATTIQFTDTSTDSDGTIASWSWSFGDGATSTSKDPTHKYSDDGTYTVALSVTDNDGGTDSESKIITVLNVAPAAGFTYSPTSPTTEDNIQFTDSSTDSDGSVVSWSWDFGDGYSSTEQNPAHKYSKGNTYTVTLIVTDDDGATNTKNMILKVTAKEEGGKGFIPGFEVVSFLVAVGVGILLLTQKRRRL